MFVIFLTHNVHSKYVYIYRNIFMYSVQFVNERIPTLKEAVSLCKELELVMFIEIKSSTTDIPRVKLIIVTITKLVL